MLMWKFSRGVNLEDEISKIVRKSSDPKKTQNILTSLVLDVESDAWLYIGLINEMDLNNSIAIVYDACYDNMELFEKILLELYTKKISQEEITDKLVDELVKMV